MHSVDIQLSPQRGYKSSKSYSEATVMVADIHLRHMWLDSAVRWNSLQIRPGFFTLTSSRRFVFMCWSDSGLMCISMWGELIYAVPYAWCSILTWEMFIHIQLRLLAVDWSFACSTWDNKQLDWDSSPCVSSNRGFVKRLDHSLHHKCW